MISDDKSDFMINMSEALKKVGEQILYYFNSYNELIKIIYRILQKLMLNPN